jgi:hypothetical protein
VRQELGPAPPREPEAGAQVLEVALPVQGGTSLFTLSLSSTLRLSASVYGPLICIPLYYCGAEAWQHVFSTSDFKHGLGSCQFPNGNTYEGEWVVPRLSCQVCLLVSVHARVCLICGCAAACSCAWSSMSQHERQRCACSQVLRTICGRGGASVE